MKRSLLFFAFAFSFCIVSAQEGSFLALDNTGQLYMVHVDTVSGCTPKPLNLCNNVRPLSIGLDGNKLYINDNQGNLYSTILDANGAVGDCKLIGSFISKSRSIYGLTVGPDGIVYAGSSNLIETYNPKTGTFGTLGRLPSNYSIGGDLMFYNGQLFEACTNKTTDQNDLVLVNTAYPSLSTTYFQFTAGNIFGFASVTKPCSLNQSYAIGQSGDIYIVDMINKTEFPSVFCQLPFKINDAASIAETQTEAPPSPPKVFSPAIFCVNTTSTPLTASILNKKDTLRWYTVPNGGSASGAPLPIIGSNPSTTSYYVSLFDTASKCEGERSELVVKVDSIITPSISIATSKTDICSGQTINFIATNNIGTTNPTFQWQINGQNVGTNLDTFNTSTISNNDKVACILKTNLSCATNSATPSNEIIIASISSSYPKVSIVASDSSFCPGTSVTLVATRVEAGVSQKLHWMINGVDQNNTTDTFITKSLINGDVVNCKLITSGKCVFPDTAFSNNIKLSVTAKILPTVTISSDTTSACAGSPIKFTSSITHGGLMPAYQWKINGRDVAGATLSTYTATSLNDQDIVTCRMISDENCLISNSATSNGIAVTITPSPVPLIQISASDTLICKGDNVSFNASVKNAGNAPVYQWLVNGVDINVNTIFYSSNLLNNDDTVSCRFIVNTACKGLDTAISNTIVIKYASLLKPTIAITSNKSTICSGDRVTFKSTIRYGGKQPVFFWMKNGVRIIGATTDSLVIDSLKDGDAISCLLTSSIPCLPVNTATSLPITIKVNSYPIVAPISGATSTCQGQSISLSNATIGGTWSSYKTSIATVSVSGVVTGVSAGDAVISYAVTNGCGTTTQKHSVTIYSNLIGDIVGVTNVCKGDSVQYLNAASIAGSWISSNTSVATINKDGVLFAKDTGVITLKYIIINTCGTNTLTKTIRITGEKPISHPFTFENPTCIKPFSGEISLDVKGAEKPYGILYNGDTLKVPFKLTKLGEGDYSFYIYNSTSCLVDSVKLIALKMPDVASCYVLHVPTGFAPVSTIGNNLLRPVGGSINDISAISFRVFNRYGNKVFESHELYNGWDGRINGVLQDVGTYIWYLEYYVKGVTDKIVQQGTSVLIR